MTHARSTVRSLVSSMRSRRSFSIRPWREMPTLAQIEMDHINEVLRLTSGNKSRAARILGISRQGLIEKLRRLRIEETSERTVERA